MKQIISTLIFTLPTEYTTPNEEFKRRTTAEGFCVITFPLNKSDCQEKTWFPPILPICSQKRFFNGGVKACTHLHSESQSVPAECSSARLSLCQYRLSSWKTTAGHHETNWPYVWASWTHFLKLGWYCIHFYSISITICLYYKIITI